MSNSTRCAACKLLRRRCPEDCILGPYFPSNNPQRFSSVHKIFGASNITRMLKRLPVEQRAIAADCMSYEAERRVEDPIYGCVKIIYGLEKKKNEIELELAKTRSEIAFHSALHAQQQQQQQQVLWSMTNATQQSDQVEPSWLNGNSIQELHQQQQMANHTINEVHGGHDEQFTSWLDQHQPF
ncbi:hypothetical protein Scep_023235 [Stephania cephalantha]|uniref:LOB domain-containing protein n=1 Tax=Stephania cephalantha TaxID=152367 RepID=A0AAP0EUD5_9MAGN